MRLGYQSILAMTMAATVGLPLLAGPQDGSVGRVTEGLVTYYTFDQSDPTGPAIEGLKGDGSLNTASAGRLVTAKPPKSMIDELKKANAITIEAWLTPANTEQSGPARIVTISRDTSHRNITLGQDGDHFDVRLRTTKTSTNGLPSTSTTKNTVETKLTHVVFSYSRSGVATLTVNGQESATKTLGGGFSTWDNGFQLALADEASGGRPWLGTLHLVAIYRRALSADEIRQNFEVGPSGKVSAEVIAQRERLMQARHFETKIAPLLADRCLECHDSATREGSLDLSEKLAAFRGGDSGAVIVAGDAADSALWTSVESDDMPHNREPLSDNEKQLLREWIEGGAVWSLDRIDPAVYEFADMSESFVQRLTIDEYIETVRAVTGVDIETTARELLPRDVRADGFSNTAYNLTVDLKHVQSYATLAEKIVTQLDVAAFCKTFSSKRGVNDNDNRDLISKMGTRLLRGPLTDEEVAAYRGIVTTVIGTGGSFDEAMAYVTEAMLQSPRFLYRVEKTDGPPSAHELAARLSYIVWGGPPDEELFRLAAEGRLDRGECAKQVARMLEHPRAKTQSLQFAEEWLNLRRLSSLRPSREAFPNWTADLASDMRDETLAFFEDTVWDQNRPLSQLLNGQFTYLTTRLANHYRYRMPAIKADASRVTTTSAPSTGESWMRVDTLTDGSRGGLLTHGSILTIGGDDASMVTRGLFVMHDLLRGVVKDPPPCVNTTPVPTAAGISQRTIAEARLANEACGGCHAKFEPLAFGLEQYDGLGAFHVKDEHGNVLRSDGTILVPGEAEPHNYATTAQLMDLLAESPRVAETITWKLTQFAMGRPLGASDAPSVLRIHQEAQAAGGTYQSVVEAIVLSDFVQK